MDKENKSWTQAERVCFVEAHNTYSIGMWSLIFFFFFHFYFYFKYSYSLQGKWAKIAVAVGTKSNNQVKQRARTKQEKENIEKSMRSNRMAIQELSEAVCVLAYKA